MSFTPTLATEAPPGSDSAAMQRLLMAQREAWQEDVLEMAVERAMRRESAKQHRESARQTLSGLKQRAARAAAKLSGAVAEAQKAG